MKIATMISAIDTHTAGEAARLITGGIPKFPGETMADKKQYLIDHSDHLRTALMHEPRGHNEMFGAFILEPTIEEADFGIIFMDAGGYLNMCGHNTIAAVTAAVETGMVESGPNAEETKVVLETPAGIVRAIAHHGTSGSVEEVSFDNVEAFLYKENQTIELEGHGKVTFDISFGGSFFAIIRSSEVGLKIEPKNASKFSQIGIQLREAINEQIEVQHPTMAHINSVDLVEFYDEPTHPEATYKNVVVFGDGQVDRSPCGTGTSAKLATLYAKGELSLGAPFVYESILGTLFKGKVVKEAKVGEFDGVIPNVSGSAYITGFNSFLIDPEDPLNHGFVLQ